MAYRRGNVVLVPFPFADARASKVRPTLVVNDPAYETETGSVIVVQITSQSVRYSGNRALRDWREAGVQHPSVVRLKLATLAAALIRFSPGSATARDLASVETALRGALHF
jgi:mRNA-degrading endonuclease toxin of MazEF toxin-antitoxin module